MVGFQVNNIISKLQMFPSYVSKVTELNFSGIGRLISEVVSDIFFLNIFVQFMAQLLKRSLGCLAYLQQLSRDHHILSNLDK